MMKDWWEKQSERDQIILFIGSIVVTILLIYAFIWNPITSSVSNLQENVTQQRHLLRWMQTTTSRIKTLRTSGFKRQSLQGRSLLAVIDQSSKAHRINPFIEELKQGENNQVVITFKQAPFDNLITWLTNLWKAYGIQAISLSAKPAETIGLVQATITLSIDTK